MDSADRQNELLAKAHLGDKFENFIASPEWAMFNENVLEPYARKAYSIYKKADPTNTAQIIWSQVMGTVIEEIKQRVFAIIQEGKAAKVALINESEEGL